MREFRSITLGDPKGDNCLIFGVEFEDSQLKGVTIYINNQSYSEYKITNTNDMFDLVNWLRENALGINKIEASNSVPQTSSENNGTVNLDPKKIEEIKNRTVGSGKPLSPADPENPLTSKDQLIVEDVPDSHVPGAD